MTTLQNGMTPATVDLPPKRRRGFDWGQPWVYLVALVAAAVAVGPVAYVWVNGFRTTADINLAPGGWPNPWTLDNYVRVLTSERFWGSVFSSTLIATGTTLGVVALGVMAAFAIARYDFRGRGALYALFAGLGYAGKDFSAVLQLMRGQLGALGDGAAEASR